MYNAEKPAFPLPRPMDATMPNIGLTKREYFAAMAMQGILSGMDCGQMVAYRATDAQGVTGTSKMMADELLKTLES